MAHNFSEVQKEVISGLSEVLKVVSRTLESLCQAELAPTLEETASVPEAIAVAVVQEIAETETVNGSVTISEACTVHELMNFLDPSLDVLQAIVIVPSRDVALQMMESVAEVVERQKLRIRTSSEGTSVSPAFLQYLQRETCHAIIGTAGRIVDFIGVLKMDQCRILAVDTAGVRCYQLKLLNKLLPYLHGSQLLVSGPIPCQI